MYIPFSPTPGLNSDDTSFASAGGWADGNNVRFWNGKPQVIGGWAVLSGGSILGTCRNILPFNRSGTVTIAYGASNKLYIGNGVSAPNDRSPAGLPAGIQAWSLAPWGSTILASPKDGKLYAQAGTSAGTHVTQAPSQITSMLVTPQRQVLAFGCNEELSGVFNPLCIRGSDLEDYADWTTSSTNNAFEHILDGPGSIVAARMVGNYVGVWTDGGLYLGQYLGDPRQTYRFERIDDNCGIIGPNAVTVFNQTAYWMSSDLMLRRWIPGTLPEAIPCPISREFAGNIDYASRSRSIACAISKFGEIWLFYPDMRDGGGENSRYIAYSIQESIAAQRPVWFRGKMARTAMADGGVLFAPLTSFNSNVIAAKTSSGLSSDLVVQEFSAFGDEEPGQRIGWYLQGADQFLDESRRRLLIRGVLPDFEDQIGAIGLTVSVRDHPQSAAGEKGPYLLVGRKDGQGLDTVPTAKKDFRASGRIVSVRLAQADDVHSFMRLGRLVFDAVPTGER
jgi:hypothetical protein